MTAGYSGTPLPKKLGIKEGSRVALVHETPGFRAQLEPLPEAVDFVEPSAGKLDLILVFTTERAVLTVEFGALSAWLKPAGMLWVAWPKKAAKVPTDLNENIVRDIGLAAGLVDVKVCAIDDVWSGLKFVVRVADRKPRAAG